MRTLEFGKKEGLFGKKMALNIIIGLSHENSLEQELCLAKEALLNWKQDRGRKAKMVNFVFSGPGELHADAENMILQIYEYEETLSPLLKSLESTAAFLDEHGQPVKEFRLGEASS
jgi:hypothetical protein